MHCFDRIGIMFYFVILAADAKGFHDIVCVLRSIFCPCSQKTSVICNWIVTNVKACTSANDGGRRHSVRYDGRTATGIRAGKKLACDHADDLLPVIPGGQRRQRYWALAPNALALHMNSRSNTNVAIHPDSHTVCRVFARTVEHHCQKRRQQAF